MLPYLHWSTTPITTLYDNSNYSSHYYSTKPKGLWLSEGTAWQDWGNEAGVWKDYKYIYQFDLHENHGLLVISDYSDLLELHDKYESWHHVAQDYTGILIQNYQPTKTHLLLCVGFKTTSGIGTNWYLGLDISCACIWTPSKAIKHFELLNHKI